MPPDIVPGSPEDGLRRAKGKLLLARQPLPDGAFWEDLCYMAQQAAELAVKALYRSRNLRFAFVHDLAQLLEGLEQVGVTVPEHIRQAEKLTVYATQMRYPGMSGFATKKDYAEVLAIAEDTVAWAEALIKK